MTKRLTAQSHQDLLKLLNCSKVAIKHSCQNNLWSLQSVMMCLLTFNSQTKRVIANLHKVEQFLISCSLSSRPNLSLAALVAFSSLVKTKLITYADSGTLVALGVNAIVEVTNASIAEAVNAVSVSI